MDVISVLPNLDVGLSCRFLLFPVDESPAPGAQRDVEHHRLISFLNHLFPKGFSPLDVFSSGDSISRETAEIVANHVRDHFQRPCRLHRRLQINDTEPMTMLQTIVDSCDPERLVCIVAGRLFLRNFYHALRRLDPNPDGKQQSNQENELRPESVLELSVLHTIRDKSRCFVEHHHTFTRKHRHKLLSILLVPSGTIVSEAGDSLRLTPVSEMCLSGLAAKSGIRLGPFAGSSVFFADADPETRLSVAYLLQKTDAVFLPTFVSLQKASKIVRLVNSQSPGSRIVLMAREAILQEVARMLLGVDSIAADSIAPNIVLLLQHHTPSCSYDDFDLGTRCIETMMTAII